MEDAPRVSPYVSPDVSPRAHSADHRIPIAFGVRRKQHLRHDCRTLLLVPAPADL
jgi:hypothetical protein